MKSYFLLIYLFILLSFPPRIFAESTYVLPYPSAMPGSFWYKLNYLHEFFDRFWYFGNFSQFTYSLKQADKYLVESKTLFEYGQYLLAYRALEASNKYFKEAPFFLLRAEKENKDISEKFSLLKNAAEKHAEVLGEIKEDVPANFLWKPEKEEQTYLRIHELIDNSINVRLNCL